LARGPCASRASGSLARVTAGVTPSAESGAVFPAAIVAGVADVASSIARFIGAKPGERPLAPSREGSGVTVMRIEAVIDMAVKTARAVEPGTCADEDPAYEPVGAVIAVRGTVIRCVIEISVGADGRRSNVDGNLGGRCGHAAHQCHGESREC
jgi:hypothetical protein